MTTRRSTFSAALAAGLAAVLTLSPGLARAEAVPDFDTSLAGNYLAARLASTERDQDAAVVYLRNLMKLDARNEEILERTFFAMLMDGQIDDAMKLADRLVKIDRTHRVARLALAVRSIKKGHYQTARTNLALSVRGPIGDLTATLLAAWTFFGSGNTKGAVELIDRLDGPDWYAPMKELHAGLILDAAGQKKEAGRRLEAAMKADPGSLRAIDAYARWASRNDNTEAALAAYAAFDKQLPNHPIVLAAIKELKAGKQLPPLVKTAQEGSSEVLYGLGATLGRQGGEDLALVYLQLAIWLYPEHPFASLTLADLYEQLKQPAKAIEVYETVPDSSPLKRNAQVQLAVNLDATDHYKEARAQLEKMIAADPKDIEAIIALGKIQQTRKMFSECAGTYSKAIALIPQPARGNWALFYFRGVCNERSKNWPAAEADLKKALELNPDQPHVLNYLGYSWVDQGTNLDQGLDMIRKAAKLRPDDGPIVDSLGWAYYRLGRYDDAVVQLERAIELMPQDPVINDHLGDAYWKVGRKLEAGFQWNHARDLKPEPDDLAKIVQKINKGLDSVDQPAPVRKAEEQQKGG
ncbi:tetratricopeptide repeat protein [Xanthobacter sp. YC-JY1]|uniref:tetratricopeptide repeat protein n=1 Tax=Xanthobacter sp. YC-JY1 TaxID=2419844 RepID=UPI001F29274A|nr:tetratricopeptide repeat protein [Xanthobacter sp. YC-JY1]UJX46543.1 tetratricopeptide repeat protein [Xanthobacter sp. YC-JY1]